MADHCPSQQQASEASEAAAVNEGSVTDLECDWEPGCPKRPNTMPP
jgi:hypothetical protein